MLTMTDIIPAVLTDAEKRGINGDSGHYNIFHCVKPPFEWLEAFFPEGRANELNFVLFSTSGVHGTYATIEDIEASFEKYGPEPEFDDDYPDDYYPPDLTFLLVHPRLVTIQYGELTIKPEHIPFLKKLRQSSWEAVGKIGVSE